MYIYMMLSRSITRAKVLLAQRRDTCTTFHTCCRPMENNVRRPGKKECGVSGGQWSAET
jgi:hypothetical protein